MKHAFATGLCTSSDNAGCFVPSDSRRNDKSKLTAEQVKNAREEYTNGMTVKELAEKYKIDYSNMRRLVKLQSYKNVV